MTQLTRSFIRTGAYRDPSGKYGINSGTSRYAVIGPKGAAEFWYFNGDYTETTPPVSLRPSFLGVLGGVEQHSKTPLYVDQTMTTSCALTDDHCFHDGTTSWADAWHKLLVHSGSEAVYAQLEILYSHWFDDGPAPDISYNPNGRDFPESSK